MAGASTIANGERHAFIYSGGAMADVSAVAVDSVSGINDANDVIGMWTPPLLGYPGTHRLPVSRRRHAVAGGRVQRTGGHQ